MEIQDQPENSGINTNKHTTSMATNKETINTNQNGRGQTKKEKEKTEEEDDEFCVWDENNIKEEIKSP